MTVIISGTDGVSDVDGTAGTPALRGTDANTGIFFGADQVGVATNGVERVEFGNSETVFNDGGANVDFRVEGDTDANLLFVDASADAVGIGTSSPNVTGDGTAGRKFLSVIGTAQRGVLDIGSTSSTGASSGTVRFVNGSNSVAEIAANSVSGSTTDGNLQFFTSNTERMRITSGGFFKASNAGTYANAAGSFHELRSNVVGPDNTLLVDNTNASSPFGAAIRFLNATPNNTTNTFLRCEDSTNDKCFIFSSGTVTNRTGTYNAFSDIKLKQDVVDASSQWNDIKALRIVKYRLKDEVAANPNYPAYIGVIAQEVEQVSPGLVEESPDFKNVEVSVLDDEGNPVLDEEGNPQVTTERQATGTVTKAVKSSIIYMKAVKALQEAIERIEALEASNTALEARIAALEAQ